MSSAVDRPRHRSSRYVIPVPAEIFFAAGASVKVIADAAEVEAALSGGRKILDTKRFAGFRGDEAVGGERVVFNVAAAAYALAIAGP